MKFNNLTLVTPHGLPFDSEYPEDAVAENVRARGEHFTRAHMASISLRSWVNVVYGKLTAIKRYATLLHSTLLLYCTVLCVTDHVQYSIVRQL